MFTQLVGAVAYVHSKSCVHRDLKLENILLDKNGNIKLCDFGFTREYEGKSSYLQTWCGTVCYSAPEMLKGEKYAAERVDVWSLGIILYALLCGELPFDEEEESDTKIKILKEEPRYPDTTPEPARDLIIALLSKRPLLRPSLADVLMNPWLAEHAPQQQAILKIQQPAPFTTLLEKEVLERMRSAGVNIDAVIENVLSQRCDPLAGWWALLLEKEERKDTRRQRKQRDRDEKKAARRISAASSQLLAMPIKESQEEHATDALLQIHERGRGLEKSGSPIIANGSEKPVRTLSDQRAVGPPQIRHQRQRSSQSRRRSQLLGEGKRTSMIHVIAPDGTSAPVETETHTRKRRNKGPILSQLASLRNWFKESSKRAKTPEPGKGFFNLASASRKSLNDSNDSNGKPLDPDKPLPKAATFPTPPRPNLSADTSSTTRHRQSSHSPSPVTPASSYRRGNLRGRKSTSSSVSSVRSMHKRQSSHSKASSISSVSVHSPAANSSRSLRDSTASSRRRSSASPGSQHLKVLPSTPTSSSFPSNVRLVRGPPRPLNLGDSPVIGSQTFSGLGPPSPGLVFAKRKRSVFKGPMLGQPRKRSDGTGTTIAMTNESLHRRPASGAVIEEEDEEDDIEEVDHFSPIEGQHEFAIDDSGELTPRATGDGAERASFETFNLQRSSTS